MSLRHASQINGVHPAVQRLKRPSLPRYKSHDVTESWWEQSVFKKRTYTASQLRLLSTKALRVAAVAITVVSVIATLLILHAWLASSPPKVDLYTANHHHTVHSDDLVKEYPYRTRTEQQQQQQQRIYRRDALQPAFQSEPGYQFMIPALELGALVNFLSSFASNSLPVDIDPAKPLHPDLVLSFNPRGAAAEEEVRHHVKDAWMRNPVVVFSDLIRGSPPASREAKKIVDDLRIYPYPTVFEVDQRADEAVLRGVLERLIGAEHLPVVIVGGNPIRSLSELRSLNETGRLVELVQAAGAKPDGQPKKKGRKH